MEYMEDRLQGVLCLLWKASVTYYFLKGIAGTDPEGGRRVFTPFFQN